MSVDSNGNITMPRGDDRTIEVTVTDSAGSSVNLAGASIKFTVKKKATDSVNKFQLTSGDIAEIELTNPANGIFQVKLVPANTSGLDPGEYQFDIEVTTSEGKVFTVIIAKLIIQADITTS